MRTLAPGSEDFPAPFFTGAARSRGRAPCRRLIQRGFTLIELMIVVALVAVASAVATLALRDPAATQLDREAARLSALLETARAESRAAGIAVLWVPSTTSEGFRFVGLPAALALPTRWLGEGVSAEVRSDLGLAKGAVLGPEPMIGAQRIVLRLDSQQLTLSTDGFGPFSTIDEAAGGDAAR